MLHTIFQKVEIYIKRFYLNYIFLIITCQFFLKNEYKVDSNIFWQISKPKNFPPQVGLEPTTHRLTADCSTTELLKNLYLLY